MDKNINTGRALSIGGEDVRPSRDEQSLLIPESPAFRHGEYVNYCYFVSFHADTFGNASVLLNHKIETYSDIKEVEKMLETNLDVDSVIVLTWKRIDADTLE